MVKYLTNKGLEKLKKELEELKTIKRKELAARLEKAIGFGDLSENAAYHEAKEAQAFLEGRILDLQEMIKCAVIVSKGGKKDSVEICSTVSLEKNPGKEKLAFMIVGSQEANLAEGKISNESPLGKALLGKRKNDIVEVETPAGRIKYKILKIE